MTVVETPAPLLSRAAFRPATYGDVLRSEWTKLRSVQATYWSLLVGAVLAIGLGALVSRVGANRHQGQQLIGWNPVDHSLRSLLIAQLAFAVLGVVTVTSEYSTGMIRTSLTAVPKRTRMMSAKLLVLTGVLFVAGQITAFATFGIGQALIHGLAPSASLGQHLVFRAVFGAGLYLTLLGLLAAGLAVLLRNAAAGIATIVALLFVLPGIANALPASWSNPIEQWWPTNAGQQVAFTIRDSHTLPAWIGFGWMALFTAVVIGVAFVLLERRDA
jgi:ABC-type transport system involved in multi-copper enzyme maturation permease subunit